MVGRPHFKSFYLENIREREIERAEVNKHACQLLSDSESLGNNAINFGCTPAGPIESLALAREVQHDGAYALNIVG